MENITIQVDSETAQAYRNADPEKQRKIQMFLNIMLKKTVNQKNLLETMQEASQEATTNGLTPEVLDSILSDD
jgi:peptidyl-tRNA hydrolase